MVKLFRAMTPDADGRPTVARNARAIGVRLEGPTVDIRTDAQGCVHPKSGGMSVAPDDPWNLPAHRRPRRLGRGSTGHDADVVFSIDDGAVTSCGLGARIDSPDRSHALIEPVVVQLLEQYEGRLAATRPEWKTDEP